MFSKVKTWWKQVRCSHKNIDMENLDEPLCVECEYHVGYWFYRGGTMYVNPQLVESGWLTKASLWHGYDKPMQSMDIKEIIGIRS